MRQLDAAIAATLLTVFAVMTITAFGYPAAARLVPLVIGLPALVLAAYQLSSSIFTSGSGVVAATEGRQRRRELAALGWLVAFAVMIALGGFSVGGTIAVVMAQRLWLRESWRTALVGGGLAFLLLYAGMEREMGFALFDGLIAAWVRG